MNMPRAFDAFVAPARARPQIWRLVLGCVVLVLVTALWMMGSFAAIWLRTDAETAMGTMAAMVQPATPRATLLLLSTFIGMALAPWIAVRLLHRRGLATLFGPWGRVLRHFGAGVLAVAGLYTASLLLWSSGFDAVPNLSPALWLSLLPLSVPLIAIQTGAEEMIFRGYLMQQIAARIRWRLAYLVAPSVLFGALHYDPSTAGGNALAIAAGAGLFGLIAADLTRVTGSLGAAWGLHFANNILAILLVSTQGTITGLSLYVTPYAADEDALTLPLILADMAVLVAVWALLRWRLRVRD
ncbi:CPBP family intramembrane glutamic endopeptidase [Palleronia rufa]|uniref:CPBP family intramembrane glutamic endopeptidase n=1 Tax=Palleronia rufa TaxID=1530186 RepID=UPI00068CBCCC|nr:type II CAAX endopeptidase family protein [Palleronia rufa]